MGVLLTIMPFARQVQPMCFPRPDKDVQCPVCSTDAVLFDVVDFNKSCEEARGKFLGLSGRPIYYRRCDACGFIFAPEFSNWSADDFLGLIYNADYVSVDPDYIDVRPKSNANLLSRVFGKVKENIRHLDFGSGNGKLSRQLADSGWISSAYEPFGDPEHNGMPSAKFNLITAFEVFEHHPDPDLLMQQLLGLVDEQFLVLFSTLVSDGRVKPNERLCWWYASPRNGHISLYSKKSLSLLAKKHRVRFGSFNDNLHVFYGPAIPSWAARIVGGSPGQALA